MPKDNAKSESSLSVRYIQNDSASIISAPIPEEGHTSQDKNECANSFHCKTTKDGTSERNEENKKCEDFDEILEIIGSEGNFQNILLYIVLSPIAIISPFLVFNTIFLWDIPDHFCHVPGRTPNTSMEHWKELTLPREIGPDGLERFSQCKMLDPITGLTTSCQNGWEYDKTDYDNTIPSEFDWVCERDHYPTDCFAWNSIGSAIGTLIFGIMADKYGRKSIFFLACATNVVFKTVSLYYAQDYLVYKTLQLLAGLSFPALFSIPTLLTAEMSGTTYRSWIYAVVWMTWVFGNSLIPLLAMLCRRWFLYGWATAIPGFLLFLYYPIMKESPRWLITVGQSRRAISIIMSIAKTNGKPVDAGQIKKMVDDLVSKTEKDASDQRLGVWSLFSKFRLAKNSIMLTIAWTMNSLLYYSVSLNSAHMAGNTFVNYFLLSIIELPGGWLAGKLVEKTGRRWTQAGFFLMCALSCLVCALASVTYPGGHIVTIGALGIKFGVTITELVAYLQGTEIFPTQLRSTGSGLACTVASTIGTLGPYIVYSGTVHVSFPYVLLGGCSIIGLLCASCLPETFQQHLPETLEDANKFGKGHKFWSYLPQDQQS